MYQRLLVLTYEIENNKILESVKKGFLMLMPVLMTGALALVLESFPITGMQQWYLTASGSYLYALLDSIYKVTYGYLSVYLAISISYNFSKHFNKNNTYLHVISMIMSTICVIACLGFGTSDFKTDSFGPTGVFTSIVISIFSTWSFYMLYRKMFWETYHKQERIEEVDYHHLSSLMVPFIICVIAFFLFNRMLAVLFHVTSLNQLFADFFGMAFRNLGNSIWSGLLVVFTESLLWFFGIHGGNTLEQVQQNLFVPANTDSTMIISKTFIDTFSLMGGCGTAICLFLALALFSRQTKNRDIMKAAAFPLLFNVNEPIVFGLPIVFNLSLLIPFILVPMVSLLIAYLATRLGIIPVTCTTVAWTTPVFLSGYVATKSIWGVVVQLVIIVVGTLIYAPFICIMEMAHLKGEQVFAVEMERLFKESMDTGEEIRFLNQHNSISTAAESLLTKMKRDIKEGSIEVYYQPQMAKGNVVYGAEALLRWDYGGKKMFPPLVIHLAQEGQLENELTLAIMKRVCEDIVRINESTNQILKISVNISAVQLNDTDFMAHMIAVAQRYGICSQLCMEVTEDMTLDHMEHIAENVGMLHAKGIELSMDDFSMGNTSLKYLQRNLFSHVKLDGQIVQNMMDNERSQEIIASIIQLGKSINFQVVAEYVDSVEKRDRLWELGCDYLQGYLYSPAVPVDEFISFMNGSGR